MLHKLLGTSPLWSPHDALSIHLKNKMINGTPGSVYFTDSKEVHFKWVMYNLFFFYHFDASESLYIERKTNPYELSCLVQIDIFSLYDEQI